MTRILKIFGLILFIVFASVSVFYFIVYTKRAIELMQINIPVDSVLIQHILFTLLCVAVCVFHAIVLFLNYKSMKICNKKLNDLENTD